MKHAHGMRVFAAALRVGFKQIFSEKLSLVGAFVMLTVLVVSYAAIFKAIPPEDLVAHQLTSAGMIWYLAATEFVLFCGSFAHFKELQYEIQTDQIHLALLRPCPVWVVKMGEWCGQYVCRFLFLAVPSYVMTYYAAGQTALSTGSILGIVASLPLAGFLFVAFGFVLGVSCLWIGQAEPAYWVWQKGLFLLGAMLWPLAMYPAMMSKLVWLTPFPVMMAVVGEWVLPLGNWGYVAKFLYQVAWGIAALFALAAINRSALRRIQRSGQ